MMDEKRIRASTCDIKDIDNDRLSSLPDSLLIDILSRFEIHTAAATSVLSRRWSNLWTGVPNLYFYEYPSRSLGDNKTLCGVIRNILGQLTAPKLQLLNILLLPLRTFPDAPDVAESCFLELVRRKVERICISICYVPLVAPRPEFDPRPQQPSWYNIFSAPASLFQIESLIYLELRYRIQLPDHVQAINFPRLTVLNLNLVNFPPWLGTLLSSCPLLEKLFLRFDLFYGHPKPRSDLQILAPNLKELQIEMYSKTQNPCAKILIDTPSLTTLDIRDSTSCYVLVQKPTRLHGAVICPSKYHDYMMSMDAQENYLHHMSRFVGEILSSARLMWLQLSLAENNLYPCLNTYFNSKAWSLSNLACLRTTLNGNGLKGWTELLRFMRQFPNLTFLAVYRESNNPSMEDDSNWCQPGDVPFCLATKIKEIQISVELNMIANLLKLLAYILSNALVLENLYVVCCRESESGETRLWNASKLCKSIFKLPRGSSTCEIVFKSELMRASSNDFKNGILTCQLYN